MSSAWKLVEAVEAQEVEQQTFEPQQHEASAGDNDDGKRFDRRGDGNRGPRRTNGGRGRGRHPGPFRSRADRSYFAFLAVQQIDLIFNPDSLCMDTFVRSYMDEEGFVPVMLVMNYQNVAALGCSYYDVINKLRETAGKTKFIEFDGNNETVRLHEGWEKFLMPNPYGGKGLPKYVKQANAQHNHYSPQGAEGEAAPAEVATTEAAASEAAPATA